MLRTTDAYGTAYAESLHGRFFERCNERGMQNRIALRSTDRQWSYGKLLARIEEISGALDEAGVRKGDIVALAACRTFDAIAAVYAVMALGAVYLPIDKQFPQDRVAYMVGISSGRWLVTDEPDRYAGQAPSCRILPLNDLAGPRRPCDPTAVAADDLAYVMFTSGTTGRPKGVMATHGSGARLLDWALDRFSQEDLHCALGATSFSFDVSIFEIFAPLACGGSLFLVNSILSLADLPQSSAITLINAVPSALTALLAFPLPLRAVRACLLAGEPVHAPLVRQLHRAGIARVYNLYGPTEDTVFSTEHLIDHDVGDEIPIGTPIPGHEFLIVDANLSPVPPGEAGELCLSGAGLAKGYINRPDLTAERFLPCPGEPRRGAIMYRTGDRVRLGRDGLLHFIGRLDSQIKLRGHRIELEEITQVIVSVPGVAQASTQLRDLVRGSDQGRETIVAYVVTQPDCCDQAGVRDAIQDAVARRLPIYMRPRHFVFLDAFPLSTSGKLESRHLPAPILDAA
ncbi:amino acid adenylation domain-containing protein [Azospirillum largimobile]